MASEANLPCLALGDSSGARPHCLRTRLKVSSPEAALPCFAPGSFSPEEASSLDVFEIASRGNDDLVRGQARTHTSSEHDLVRVRSHVHGRFGAHVRMSPNAFELMSVGACDVGDVTIRALSRGCTTNAWADKSVQIGRAGL